MQCVVADWKASAGHVPDVPVHVSATSHWPAEARHVTVAALYASKIARPACRERAEISAVDASLYKMPMQCVVADWKASAGHVPDVPVHISATSHWPAEARQVTLAALYASTQTMLVPVQWSAGSSSHTPLCELPMQCVVADWKASAGHVPDVPSHVCAAGHERTARRPATHAAWYTSTHALLVPVQ